ncbi:MAG TPA: MFS transporter [Gaiella sp.]|nr:MFS transporter [Gaiella sp.]
MGRSEMRRLGVPRRTLAITAANSLAAAGQGQFMFVLPWMLLALGHEPRDAALATAFVYVPLLVTAVPAGLTGDNVPPLRVLRIALAATLGASLVYPVAVLVGWDWFGFVLLAAVVTGVTRNYGEAAVMRGIADTTQGPALLRAHAVRTTVNQAALFGSPFLGLLLFRLGGAALVLVGICVLHAVALALLVPVPRIGGVYERRERDLEALRRALDSVRANPRLRRIGAANLTWNVFTGSALGILPAVLREHLGLDEITASAAFIAGMVVVVLGTLPVTRGVQRRLGPFPAFLAASAIQGAALLLFVPSALAVLAPLLVAAFLLSNSTAAASLNGARALEIGQDQQALLSLIVMTLGMIGFVLGLLLAALLLGFTDFGLVLALTGLGMAVTAAAFRRPLLAT